MTNFAHVLLPIKINQAFTYDVPAELGLVPRGALVNVPFRGQSAVGVVLRCDTESAFNGKVKSVASILPLPPIPEVVLAFVTWVADYTLSPLGNVLKMIIGTAMTVQKNVRKPLLIASPNPNHARLTLSEEQAHASAQMAEAVSANRFEVFLLDGVTGSGKTEVYMEVMKTALGKGQQILVLLPEIALTAQCLARFERQFGCPPLAWHSGLSESVKRQTWQAVLSGEAKVVVGARSALFLPFPNLGLIVVDEEHDASYKQEEQVIYNARDMAVVRAKLSQAVIILVSATPSLETLVNAQEKRYTHLVLTQRHGGAQLPDIHVVDMRLFGKTWISPPLQQAITEVLNRQEQAVLFLNRRGYAPITLCKQCGYRCQCPGCTSCLVEHKASATLKCHHCGYTQAAPTACPECSAADSMIPCGPGVERIYEVTTKLFPEARCIMLTSDLVDTPKKLAETIDAITNHEVDIIVGTQLLAKGHHFPRITLVGIVDGDLGMSGGDLRACERTYQLMHQVAGRAGREERQGRVLLQTYNPEHGVIQAMKNQDRDGFFALEKDQRQHFLMPPYARLASMIISGLSAEQVDRTAERLAHLAPRLPEITILGPSPAPLALLRSRHRRRFLIKAPKNFRIQSFIASWLEGLRLTGNVTVQVDIDPYSFY